MKETPTTPPIACTLDATSLQQRKGLLWELLGRATEWKEVSNGFEFSFACVAVNLSELTKVVELERKCCKFLRFVITVEPDGGPVRLELTGVEGTKEFLAALLPAR